MEAGRLTDDPGVSYDIQTQSPCCNGPTLVEADRKEQFDRRHGLQLEQTLAEDNTDLLEKNNCRGYSLLEVCQRLQEDDCSGRERETCVTIHSNESQIVRATEDKGQEMRDKRREPLRGPRSY